MDIKQNQEHEKRKEGIANGSILLPAEEVAIIMNVNKSTVCRWVNTRDLPATTCESKKGVYFRMPDLVEWWLENGYEYLAMVYAEKTR